MNDKCPQCGYHLSDFLKTQLTAQLDEKYLARETKKLAEFSTRFEEREMENLQLKQKISESEKIIELRMRQKIKEENEAWQKEIVDQLHEKENDLSKSKTQNILLEGKIKNFSTIKEEEIKQAKAIARQQFKAHIDSENLLKFQKKDNEILHLKTSIKDLEIKAAQGSQQAQGEVGRS